ncbi:MAG TPA: glycosyltransferase family 4 protein [Usitatibacter sp.]|nr:glycosyltransferase family 4 protein [Usitatibacter sp.]
MTPVVVILGPDLAAVSGVSTHVNMLLHSSLADEFELVHFQVGSEGRDEGPIGRALRLAFSPLALFFTILFRHASVVHINTSLNRRAYWRDLAYLAVAKLLRARVVYQVHGGELPEKFFAGRPWLTAWLRWSLRLPDLVVVLASCELSSYRSFVPGQAVVALPNGIDCWQFEHIVERRSTLRDPLRLIYVGRVAREKGLYETLQAMRLALELGVDARLTVAGGGEELSRLQRYAAALGIGSRVAFVGPVFGHDKVNLLAGADAMVLASYSEGLPYALLEGMAAGLPVVATPVGAVPDVVAHGTHGYLVPLKDAKAIAEALALLAGDRERLEWMARACRRRVRAAYSIERLAAELGVRYHELAGSQAMAAQATPARAAPRAPQRTRAPVTLVERRD